jgi:hypothetical protein
MHLGISSNVGRVSDGRCWCPELPLLPGFNLGNITLKHIKATTPLGNITLKLAPLGISQS